MITQFLLRSCRKDCIEVHFLFDILCGGGISRSFFVDNKNFAKFVLHCTALIP